MDDIAEKGYASHWKYKGISNIHGIYDHWFDSIKEVLETPHNDAIEFLNDFKSNLYGEEVYIYTPKGEMKVMPKGATALDFAFGIHTDVGYHASGFKVNNKLVPMGYILESGDQIQVITNKNQKPTEDWLKIVITGKAKSKIRSSLKEVEKKRAEDGKEILERKLKNSKLDIEDNFEVLMKLLACKSKMELYIHFSDEKFDFAELLKKFSVDNGRLTEIKSEPKETIPTEEDRPSRTFSSNTKILINGESGEQYQYSLAPCCNPVLGDEIFAYVGTNSGLKIHRTQCRNAEHLMASYGYRVLKAEWAPLPGSSFNAMLIVHGIDDGPGVIERLTHTISSRMGVNIRSFSIEGNEGTFEGKIGLIVRSKEHLNQIIQSLAKLQGVNSVTRLDN